MIKEEKGIKTSTGDNFRLVHDSVNKVAVIEGTAFTFTSTKHSVEEFIDQASVDLRVGELNLIQGER